MAVVGELLVLIGANNGPLTAAIASSEAQMKGFGASTTNAMAGIRMAALGVGVAAVAGLGIAANAAGDFQEQMATINTIARQSPAELDKTGQAIIAMSTKSGTGLNDLTGAFYDLLSAGIKPGAEAINALQLANTLAIGGLATTKQTVDLLTTAINAYGLNAHGAKVATDQFALAIQDGKVTADQIAATFADVAPLAKTAGVGIDEISASYAVLTARGTPAAEAMTQMNRVMVELLKPNATLTELQDKLGVSFAKVAADKGLVVALEEMRKGAEANGVPFQDLFGRLEGLKFALATTGPAFATYQSELTAMHSATGTAAAQAEERMGTFNRQMMILGATLNAAAISAGTALLPALTQIAGMASDAVKAFAAWSDANPGLASNILLVVAAVAGVVVAAASLGTILGIVGTAISVITSPILLVVAAIAGLAAHFGLLGSGAKNAVDGFGATIMAAIPQVLATLEQLGGQVLAWIGAQVPIWGAQLMAWGQAFIGWIAPMIPPALAALGDMAGQLFDWVTAQIPGWVAQLGSWAGAFVDWISPMIPKALAALGDLAAQGIAWVASQLPVWGAALLRWADAFIGWIGPMIPKALTALGQFALALGQWIVAQIPVVAIALGKMAVAFVSWILPKIPSLIVELGKFGAAALLWVAQQIPGIVVAVGKWAVAFIGWIAGSIPGALVELGKWLVGVLQWIAGAAGKFFAAALEWGKQIVAGIMAGIGDIAKRVGDKLNEIPGVKIAGGAVSFTIGAVVGSGGAPVPLPGTTGYRGGAAPANPIPHAAGVWNVGADHLAYVHAGEMVIPRAAAEQARSGSGRGGGGGPIHLTHTTILQVEGRSIAQIVEEVLFNNASAFSSGFADSPVTT